MTCRKNRFGKREMKNPAPEMKIIQSVSEMKEWSRSFSGSVGLVPTMGYLHRAHLELIQKSLDACDATVASLFVNPAQFSPGEDFENYPRDREGDRAKLDKMGVDVLFMPDAEAMYPAGFKTCVDVRDVTRRLCGATRPDYFRGMATIVLKLFNIVRPDKAFFGEKDWQQLQVIKTLVRDLNLDVAVESLPIVRDADGLALSSRNEYLNAAERRSALALNRGLQAARELADSGTASAHSIRDCIREIIEREPSAEVEFISICDPESFEELDEVGDGALVALAVRMGKARLIDNCLLEKAQCKSPY